MRVLSYLLDPLSEGPQRVGLVDGVDQEYCGDAFVEGSDEGLEELLACLCVYTITVSHI